MVASALSSLTLASLALLLTLTLSAVGQELSFEVMEESGPGLLGNVATKANLTSVLGQQELNSLEYTVVEDSSMADNLFYVDQTSGDLSTTTTLDRERLCGSSQECVVHCDVAVQSSSPDSAFFRKFSVRVKVIDVNDNPPQFSQTSFVVNIPENAVTDTVFVLPTASDPDVQPEYKVQRYALEPKFKQFDLSVIRTTTPMGEVQFAVNLKVTRPLDREAQRLYITSLVAYDGGNPPRKAILPLSIDVMDKNDNAPQFEDLRYSQTLTEEAPKGATALTVSARDADEGDNARVSYFMANSADSEAKEIFAVNQDTGAVWLKTTLRNRGGKTYDFEVVARDNGMPQKSSVCRVTIEVQDTQNDRPELEIKPLISRRGAALVPESAAIGKVTALLTVRDHDSGRNGLVTCDLDNAFFSLQKLELNEYKVIVAAALDRERRANHTVTIRCTDGGDPPLSRSSELRVEVSDSNDNAPEFTSNEYVLSVAENEVVGTWVGQVRASDVDSGDNADLIYGMDKNGDTFTIDTILGDIYTTRFLDREDTPSYRFKVFAYDKSAAPLTAMATVVVNVADRNDLRPKFTNATYHFRVDERTPPGSMIGEVKATDGDLGLNARVEYYLVTSQPRPRFPLSVNSSGAILVTGDIDYEAEDLYQFVVAAVDLGSPPQNSTCHVTVEVVDRNDHTPVITFPSHDNPSVSIPFDTAPGSEIAKVVAYDLDSGANGDLRYGISVANTTSVFFIDELSGIISLGDQLLPSDVRSYNVVVSVRDNGVPQMAQQALLKIEVAASSELMQSDTNMKIVIALVCVTLFLALAVLTTLLLIRYFDRKRRTASEKHRHEILTKSGYQPEPMEKGEAYRTEKGEPFRTATVFTSSREDTTVYSPKRDLSAIHKAAEAAKNKKKTVSFERDRHPSIMEEEGDLPLYYEEGGYSGVNDTYPVQAVGELLHSPGSFSTFKPPPRPHLYEEQQRRSPQQGVSGSQDKDQPADAVHFALRQHNALVRSIRNTRPPPYQQQQGAEPRGDKDVEVWSSSSADTSDSGHGGSEIDVSTVKVSV
ncbi:protocadherin-9-like [Littorina saxatilis]|uniref:Cadherin domain-containing protein n=1 Tax=Littorina saxatilis TaxID=31220 RepID=A0AAN9AMC4_9CAEN